MTRKGAKSLYLRGGREDGEEPGTKETRRQGRKPFELYESSKHLLNVNHMSGIVLGAGNPSGGKIDNL